MLERLPPSRRNLALALVAAASLWFAWTVRSALNPLLTGFLLAYILHPLVLRLERRGWSRKIAVNLIFAAFALAFTLTVLGLAVQARALWRDVVEQAGSLGTIQARIESAATAIVARIESWGIDLPYVSGGADAQAPAPTAGSEAPGAAPQLVLDLDGLVARLREWLASEEGRAGAAEAGLRAAGGVWHVLERLFGSLVAGLTWLALVPLYAWFLLFELERIAAFVRRHIPSRHRAQAERIGGAMTEMLASFFRGRLVVCLLKGVVLTLVMFFLGVPYALLLGMASGFLSLVPFVGPAIGYGLAFLLSLLEHSALDASWRIAIVFSVGEVVEGYVLIPKILGESLGLHPVVVIASLTIFGSVLGMFGLLIALPLTAAIVILVRELVLPALREFAEEKRP
jgi:predicted PurR-regulated permease PerM